MPREPLRAVVDYLRDVSTTQELQTWTDSRLLELFVYQQEEAAFSALVRRHGPMVLGVCRRVLGDEHNADDAFQATFMVLIKRASSVDRQKPLGNWLYGVAQRVALKAKAREAARHVRQRELRDVPGPETIDEQAWQELRCVLDEQIGHLPNKYRAPIVLCYFQGKTHEQAAQELGWPRKSLSNRLASACDMLRRQLTSRGIALSAGALATVLIERAAPAAVGGVLAINTTKAALSFAAGATAAGGVISAQSITLAQTALKGMFAMKLKLTLAVLSLGLVLSGVGVAGYHVLAPGVVDSANNKEPPPQGSGLVQLTPPKLDAPQKKDTPAVDLYGDLLPPGAVARLGTERWRHQGQLALLSFTSSGELLLAELKNTLSRFDPTNGKRLGGIEVKGADFDSLAISADSKIALTRDLDVIDVDKGVVVRRLEGDERGYFHLGLSANGKRAAVLLEDPVRGVLSTDMGIWDVESGKALPTLKCKHYHPLPIVFSPDGSRVISCSMEGVLSVWDVMAGKPARQLEFGKENVMTVLLSSNGKVLAVQTVQDIRLFEFETLKSLGAIKLGDMPNVIEGSRSIRISPKGGLIAVVESRGIYPYAKPIELDISLWDVQKQQRIGQFAPGTGKLAFSPGEDMVYTADNPSAGVRRQSVIRRWDTATCKEIDPLLGHTCPILDLSFGADGGSLFSSGEDGNFLQWDLATFKLKNDLVTKLVKPSADLAGWKIAAVSPDCRILALNFSSRDKDQGTLKLWDAHASKELHTLGAELPQGTTQTRFSADGRLVSFWNGKDVLQLWEVASGKELFKMQGVRQAALSPDSKLLLLGEEQYKVRLIEIDSGMARSSWKHENGITLVTFSPDGRFIAYGVYNKEIWIRDARSGSEILHLTDHGGASVAFSPSGRTAIVGRTPVSMHKKNELSYTGVVEYWDLLSGHLIRRMVEPPSMYGPFAFSPDGRTLASGGGDSTVLLWDLTDYGISGKFGKYKQPPELSDATLQALWADLAGDAPKAEKALWTLSFSPNQSLPRLQESFQIPKTTGDEIAKLLATLDSPMFTTRQKAADSLEKLGEAAEAAVRKHLQGDITPEVRQRLDQFIKNRDKDLIRNLRAIEVLELIGNADARQLLETLAKDAPNPRVSDAAARALARLKKRS